MQVGDTVRIVTTDGSKQRFKGTGLTADGLVGADTAITYGRIVTIEREDTAKNRERLKMAGAAILFAGAVVIAAAATVTGGGAAFPAP